MRIDFNQHGSWRKGPDMTERDEDYIMQAAALLADLLDADLRIVDDRGWVYARRQAESSWIKTEQGLRK